MNIGLKAADIYLPNGDADLSKWAVVACDQFTSQRDYWDEVESLVGSAPSTLRLTLPEIDLDKSAERVPAIHRAMADYLATGVLQPAVHGFILTERVTESGVRPGLLAALDLECYEYAAGTRSLIRPTEGTVPSRVPPRAAIRREAILELPHVMMLIDDHGTVIDPLYQRRAEFRPLYDFELMQGGGHLRGWALESEAEQGLVFSAMEALAADCGGLLYAVGDGNHSLAAAKKCWEDLKPTLSPAEQEAHPARYALVELNALDCPALQFEPIHRIIFGADAADLQRELEAAIASEAAPGGECATLILPTGDAQLAPLPSALPVLQAFLDKYLAAHPAVSIDYIHGDETLRSLVAANPGAVGLLLPPFDKARLFPAIRRSGVLPRKTFSIGHAFEKRYYLEARKIK